MPTCALLLSFGSYKCNGVRDDSQSARCCCFMLEAEEDEPLLATADPPFKSSGRLKIMALSVVAAATMLNPSWLGLPTTGERVAPAWSAACIGAARQR